MASCDRGWKLGSRDGFINDSPRDRLSRNRPRPPQKILPERISFKAPWCMFNRYSEAKTTQLGNSPPEMIAKMLLSELVGASTSTE